MPLIGDLLMDVRRRIPDLPSVMSAPSNSWTIGSAATGGTLPAATYYLVLTALNGYGETLKTSEQNTGALSGSTNEVTAALTAAQIPVGATLIRAYVGTATTVYTGFIQSAVTAGSSLTLTLKNLSDLTMGLPPSRSSAFIPDTDGNFISAQQLYSILNRGITEMVRIGGGIVDVTGIQSQNGQAIYRAPALFYSFTNAWFDGYPLAVVPRRMVYLRQSVAGFSGLLSFEQDGAQGAIQTWPQSNRTGVSTTLSSSMGTTDVTVNVASATNMLSIGLVQVDSEVMAYSTVSGNALGGVLRGLGGTDVAAHSSGAPVTELNIRLSGRRLARTYQTGDAALTIGLPLGWESPVPLYMESAIRAMEQDIQASKSLLSDFVAEAEKIAKASRLGQIRPRQIMVGGVEGLDTYNRHLGGGWLVS